ncbi:type I-B CRISPR-associated protein Cas5b [Thermoanaerobacterium thermosaccharolyticum]|jgi:CRISPR-associated protein Cas5t|uniref:type I-B CRISPR-associated protein Cas5b n=1 Tax=Thermoanaerobacterium thermosaccharolyticum TaxID=1517 RepID=UPI0017866F8C|nr:type I-B CRISPR-associated protein Cas5b [Thermoanaerobacterium thermosaccharolyticum]MBE0069223.1 type I-B CRISPR-associated protein Cas5 [Thermoanaerobacterium thermosaccharolyticum]MBE0228105.1 type I-B CRISPR-associated protein Cas5 [Thermoanaerobacterium thermosaccharolyticum]
MKVLRIKLYQPEANYRIPFSYQRRFTYPIPPYSTVKGLICNLLGIDNENEEMYKNVTKLSMAIYGRYDNLVKDYIWFRNLSIESHTKRFFSKYNRTLDFSVQHPGGQIPVKIDVLNNVHLIIYIYHENVDFLEKIRNAFVNPVNRNSTIHLGRSEDWLVFEEIKYVDLNNAGIKDIIKFDYYTWMPEQDYLMQGCTDNKELYKDYFNKIDGNLFRLPTFYSIKEGKRIFDKYIIAKLYEKGSVSISPFDKCYLLKILIDGETNLPIFLADLGGV